MGLIFSKFKEKTTTKEVLQNIEDDINVLEDFKATTQEWQKKILRRLVIYSVVFYFLACLLAFFFPTMSYKLYLYIGLVLFPGCIYFLRRALTWHYRRSIKKNDKRLQDLQDKRQKILDQIMETETYKVAREILEQFAPDQLRKHTPLRDAKNSSSVKSGTPGTEVRRRNGPGIDLPPPSTPAPRPAQMVQSTPVPKTVGRALIPPQTPARIPMPNLFQRGTPMPQHQQAQQTSRQNVSAMPTDNVGPRPSGPPMPRPLLPRERGYMNRVLDYLVGDGPSNRFALICRQCESHNGMALKEEFEFLSFRCCYCYYWNPAKKQRPVAPRLSAQYNQSHSYPEFTSPRLPPPSAGMNPVVNTEEDGGDDSSEEDAQEISISGEETEEEVEFETMEPEIPKPPPDVTLPSQVAQIQKKNPEKDSNDVSQMDVE